jgi:hypothetical protein
MIISPRDFTSLTILTEAAAHAARMAHEELTKVTTQPVLRLTTNTDHFKSGVWVDPKGQPLSIPLAGILQPGARLGPYGNQSDKPRSKWDVCQVFTHRLSVYADLLLGEGRVVNALETRSRSSHRQGDFSQDDVR